MNRTRGRKQRNTKKPGSVADVATLTEPAYIHRLSGQLYSTCGEVAYVAPPRTPPGILLPPAAREPEPADMDEGLHFMLPKEIHADLMLHDDAAASTRTPSDDARESTSIPAASSQEFAPDPESVPNVPRFVQNKYSNRPILRHCQVPELVRAAEKGDLEAICTQLDQGADPNSKDDFDLTALHGASKKGHHKVVEFLLERRAHVNAQASALHGEMPLHYACKYGHRTVVQLLLKSGASMTAVTTEGRTPWHWARKKQHHEIADLLAEAAAAGGNGSSIVSTEFFNGGDGSIMRMSV